MKKYLILNILCTAAYLAQSQSVTLTPDGVGTSTEGRMYYDNIDKVFKYWNGSTFVPFGGTSGVGWAITGTHLYNTNAGNIGIGLSNPTSKLTIRHNASNMLSLTSSNSLGIGVTNSIIFGGSNYSTGLISTIGTSTLAARMAFSTGTSFISGALFMQERLSIANNGYIGINQVSPQATLDIGGGIRFSGTHPSAFVLTVTNGVNTYNSEFMLNSGVNDNYYLKLDHPRCNSNPNAIIMVTPQIADLIYHDSFWYIKPMWGDYYYITGFNTYTIGVLAGYNLFNEPFYYPTSMRIPTVRSANDPGYSPPFPSDGKKYNILLIQN